MRERDAGRTRALLLAAGLRRFALEGYASTTVRHVAEDAGVDVALIKRYFGSKEGLFSACLQAADDDLRAGAHVESVAQMADLLAHRALGMRGHAEPVASCQGGPALLLLLRTAGDDGIDESRRQVLHRYGQQLATMLREVGPFGQGRPEESSILLRAQVAMATAIGVAVLCVSPGLEPLRSARPCDLAELLVGLLDA